MNRVIAAALGVMMVSAAAARADTSVTSFNCASGATCSENLTFKQTGGLFIRHVTCDWSNDTVYKVEIAVLSSGSGTALDKYYFVLNDDERDAGAMSRGIDVDMYAIHNMGVMSEKVTLYNRNGGANAGSCYVNWVGPLATLRR